MCCIPVLLTFSAASTWVQATNSGSHLMGLQEAHFPCSRQRLFKMLLLCLKFPVCFISIRIQPLSKAYRVLCDGVPLPHLWPHFLFSAFYFHITCSGLLALAPNCQASSHHGPLYLVFPLSAAVEMLTWLAPLHYWNVGSNIASKKTFLMTLSKKPTSSLSFLISCTHCFLNRGTIKMYSHKLSNFFFRTVAGRE